MILAVDIGNSAAKLGLFRGGRLVRAWRVPHGKPLPRLPKGIDLTAVSSVNPAALKRIRPKLPAPVLLAGRDFRVPLKGGGRATGTDRLLASYAAWRVAEGPVAVIDFGTAVTLNLVDAKGRFLGGAIFAGPETARKALALRATGLPLKGISAATRADLRTGTLLAYRGFVAEALALAKRRLGLKPRVFLTGGKRPDLVLYGLALSVPYPLP